MTTAYKLPEEWAEEMITVDDFFVGGNIFQLKIIKNPAKNLSDVNEIFFWNLIKINYKDNFGTIHI